MVCGQVKGSANQGCLSPPREDCLSTWPPKCLLDECFAAVKACICQLDRIGQRLLRLSAFIHFCWTGTCSGKLYYSVSVSTYKAPVLPPRPPFLTFQLVSSFGKASCSYSLIASILSFHPIYAAKMDTIADSAGSSAAESNDELDPEIQEMYQWVLRGKDTLFERRVWC